MPSRSKNTAFLETYYVALARAGQVVAQLDIPLTLSDTTLYYDFDFDFDIDGADLLKWQRDEAPTDSLDAWEHLYGYTLVASTSTPVPEPSTLVILVLGFYTSSGRLRSR